jgi:hypothetical protein
MRALDNGPPSPGGFTSSMTDVIHASGQCRGIEFEGDCAVLPEPLGGMNPLG